MGLCARVTGAELWPMLSQNSNSHFLLTCILPAPSYLVQSWQRCPAGSGSSPTHSGRDTGREGANGDGSAGSSEPVVLAEVTGVWLCHPTASPPASHITLTFCRKLPHAHVLVFNVKVCAVCAALFDSICVDIFFKYKKKSI